MFIILFERLGITLDNKNIIYRPASLDDAEKLWSLEAIRLQQTTPRPEIILNSQIEAHWNELMSSGLDRIHVAQFPDEKTVKLIAYAALGEPINDTDFFVLENYRHRGIGPNLLKAAGVVCEHQRAKIFNMHDYRSRLPLAVAL